MEKENQDVMGMIKSLHISGMDKQSRVQLCFMATIPLFTKDGEEVVISYDSAKGYISSAFCIEATPQEIRSAIRELEDLGIARVVRETDEAVRLLYNDRAAEYALLLIKGDNSPYSSHCKIDTEIFINTILPDCIFQN